jgi:hypothetical protein
MPAASREVRLLSRAITSLDDDDDDDAPFCATIADRAPGCRATSFSIWQKHS